jgi:hypothetical protein
MSGDHNMNQTGWRKRQIAEIKGTSMTKDDIIKALRDMAKYPTVTLPRDCEALRAAADLLAQPEQEPAAWMYPDDLKRFETSEAYAEAYSIEMGSPQGTTVPLYTIQSQRKWVGLTPKEVAEIVIYTMNKTADLVRIIEAKLKEKNEY